MDFSKIRQNESPTGKEAFNLDKSDYGNFGNNEAYYEGGEINISWQDARATVTGKLKWLGADQLKQFIRLSKEGNYFAFSLSEWFNTKEITVDNGGNTHSATDTDWVCNVSDKKKPIVVKYKDTVIATFDLSGVELGKKAE